MASVLAVAVAPTQALVATADAPVGAQSATAPCEERRLLCKEPHARSSLRMTVHACSATIRNSARPHGQRLRLITAAMCKRP